MKLPTPLLMAIGVAIGAARVAQPVPLHPAAIDPVLFATAATLMLCSLGVARSRRK